MKYLRKRLLFVLPLVALLALAVATPAFAQAGGPTVETVATSAADATLSINIMWMIIGGFLGFFLQAGFPLVEPGFPPNKNGTHTRLINMMGFRIWAFGDCVTGSAFT